MLLPETTVVGDLLIENGIISAIQPGGGLVANDDVRTIDATGLHLLPGLICLLYTSPSPRDMPRSRMPSSA